MTAPCTCSSCRLSDAADRVLAGADIVDFDGLVLVSDRVIARAAERGLATPSTWTMRRGDGRAVHVFKLPDAAA